MSDLKKSLFSSLRDGVQRAATEIGQELAHKGEQGAHELAAALFHGNAFVMYPKNQAVEQPTQTQDQPQQEQSHSIGR